MSDGIGLAGGSATAYSDVGVELVLGVSQVESLSNELEDRVERRTQQLERCDETSHCSAFQNIVLAYEPVWAIGTGETASPEQAQEMHAFIRNTFNTKYGEEVANNISILYGGSVKPNNAQEIFAKPDVDGGLIGGASLKAEDFFAIVNAF